MLSTLEKGNLQSRKKSFCIATGTLGSTDTSTYLIERHVVVEALCLILNVEISTDTGGRRNIGKATVVAEEIPDTDIQETNRIGLRSGSSEPRCRGAVLHTGQDSLILQH